MCLQGRQTRKEGGEDRNKEEKGVERKREISKKEKEGQSENKEELELSEYKKALYQDNLHSPLPLRFQSLCDSTVTNTLFTPTPSTCTAAISLLYPPALTFLLFPLDSLCLTSFLFISVSNSLLLLLSIGPSVSPTIFSLPHLSLNLPSTAHGVTIWQGNVAK